MRIRAGVSSIAVVAVTAMTMMVFSPLATTAGAHGATEMSTCRGSVLRLDTPLIDLEPVVVQNAAGQDCTQQTKSLIGPIDLGILQVAVGNAKTKIQGTAHHPNTTAEVANLTVTVPGVLSIGADVIRAQVNAGKCTGTFGTPTSRPSLTSAGIIANLFINGQPIEVGSGPVNIPILGLATLSLNKVTKSDFSITRQALVLSVPLLGIQLVVSEAQAGFTGHPCDAV